MRNSKGRVEGRGRVEGKETTAKGGSGEIEKERRKE